METLSRLAAAGRHLSGEDVGDVVARACQVEDYRGKRVLLIVPDATRTAPVGLLFASLYQTIGEACRSFDIMIALGTHHPMDEAAICRRLEITPEARRRRYSKVGFYNHEWDRPAALRRVGMLYRDEIAQLTSGRFSMDIPVEVNRRLFEYDQVILAGPVFPHEVVGFSGGNKYLFPGVSGPAVLHFFHWLAAVMTNPRVIGHPWTAVRQVIDRAAALVDLPKLCFCMVVESGALAGLFAGAPEAAWKGAIALSARIHIRYEAQPFQRILSCAPRMYDDLWVGGKCMYKLEPVLADGGELIIYAPHITEVSYTHGAVLRRIGYHCRDYFLKQWDRFKDIPWGILAHSTHVYGGGTYEDGKEEARAHVSLATGIPRDTCQRINLGYLDPQSIRRETFESREGERTLYVPQAGEMLYRLKDSPRWAEPEQENEPPRGPGGVPVAQT